ncbi:MAG: ABC transporter ATP-binding protein [Thermoplasmata archaeon]
MASIELEGVTKWYARGAPVLRNVSFREEGPGAVGVLGPNGAGKTTALKLLVGLLRPSRGSVTLNGFDPVRARRCALEDVGAVVESPEPYPSETIFDALERVGRLRGLDEDGIDEEIDRLHLAFHLPPLPSRCGGLSKGERQRVVLAAACFGDPRTLLLDEPTNGMDPAERTEVLAFLGRLKRDHLILISSHLIDDLARICDRLLFLDRGAIRLRTTVEELGARTRADFVDIEFVRPLVSGHVELLGRWARGTVRTGDRTIRLWFDGTEATRAGLLQACGQIGGMVRFAPASSPIEAAYREMMDSGTDGSG